MEDKEQKEKKNLNTGNIGTTNSGGYRQGRGGRFDKKRQPRRFEKEEKEFDEKVIQVSRVSKKTKGGNKIGFSVLMVVGDKKGRVGVGLGKGPDVSSSIRKGVNSAKRRLLTVPMKDGTVPYEINLKHGAAEVMLKPAPKGTGVIAGGPVRAVVEAAGIKDIVSKIKGTRNKASNVYATFEALKNLKEMRERREDIKVYQIKK